MEHFSIFLFHFLRFYLFFMRDGKERERNNDVSGKHWLIASWTGMRLQPRRVSQLAVKPVTFCSWYDTQLTEPHWSGPHIFFFQSEHIVLKQDSSSSLLISCYTTEVCWVTEEMTWLSLYPNVTLHSSAGMI